MRIDETELFGQCEPLRREAARLIAATVAACDVETLAMLARERDAGATLAAVADGDQVAIVVIRPGWQIAAKLLTVTADEATAFAVPRLN